MIDKERIEKAIDDINGLIMDFTDVVKPLHDIKAVLYDILENNAERNDDLKTERKNNYDCYMKVYLVIDDKRGDVEFIKKLYNSKKIFDLSVNTENGKSYTGSMKIADDPVFDFEKNTALVNLIGSLDNIE
jgi:hypothetical protein